MQQVRILAFSAIGSSSIGASIRARVANTEVVEVTTKSMLNVALRKGTYHAVCIQYPLPWLPMKNLVRMLHDKLPNCPVIMVTHANTLCSLEQLAELPDMQMQRTA